VNVWRISKLVGHTERVILDAGVGMPPCEHESNETHGQDLPGAFDRLRPFDSFERFTL
jgi:hypothetical protein